MPPSFIDRITPRVLPRTRLLTAALLWSAVGVMLAGKGIYLSREISVSPIFLMVIIGLGLGVLKSRYIFDRMAEKIITHIRCNPARACLGGLFSLRNWALILVMMSFGHLVGASGLDTLTKTAIYVTVGSGLAFSSRRLWSAWKHTSPADLHELRRI